MTNRANHQIEKKIICVQQTVILEFKFEFDQKRQVFYPVTELKRRWLPHLASIQRNLFVQYYIWKNNNDTWTYLLNVANPINL